MYPLTQGARHAETDSCTGGGGGFRGVGCAPKRLLTPQEIEAERDRQLRMVTRVYEGKSSEEILRAADRVFRLADDDYNVSHTQNSVHAQRNWMIYLVLALAMGTDSWTISTEPVENGIKVTAMHSAQSSSVTGAPTPTSGGGMGVTALTSPGMQSMTTTPAIYQLFFSRLDHLLGVKPGWLTCKDAKRQFTEGDLGPFCTVASDRTPDGISAAQRSRN